MATEKATKPLRYGKKSEETSRLYEIRKSLPGWIIESSTYEDGPPPRIKFIHFVQRKFLFFKFNCKEECAYILDYSNTDRNKILIWGRENYDVIKSLLNHKKYKFVLMAD